MLSVRVAYSYIATTIVYVQVEKVQALMKLFFKEKIRNLLVLYNKVSDTVIHLSHSNRNETQTYFGTL